MLPKGLGPLAYDGRNRSFFFFSYEGIRYDSAIALLSRVPTEIERRGDFRKTFMHTSSGAFIPVQLLRPRHRRARTQQDSGFIPDTFEAAVMSGRRLNPVAMRAAAVISASRTAHLTIRPAATTSSATPGH